MLFLVRHVCGTREDRCDPTSSNAGCRSVWKRSAPLPGAELLHVLMLPDFERADAIGSYWGNPKTRAFAELLIDCEEDRVLRAVLVGMLLGGILSYDGAS